MITTSAPFSAKNKRWVKQPVHIISIQRYQRTFTNRYTGVDGQYDWLKDIDDLTITVNDLNGGASLSDLVFHVQDHNGAITADFPNFTFEGKKVVLRTGFKGMRQADFATLFVGLITDVSGENNNQDYVFTCTDIRQELSRIIFTLADDGKTKTDDAHPRTLNGNPMDILISILQTELGLDQTDFDLAGIQQLRDQVYSGVQFVTNITSAPVAKDFIENELMKPLGCYLWPNAEGQICVHSFYPAPANFPQVITRAVTNIDDVARDQGVISCPEPDPLPRPSGYAWQWEHDGGTPGSSCGNSSIVTAPSTTGTARKFDFSWAGYGGERFHVYLGTDNLDQFSTRFIAKYKLRIEDLTHVEIIELDLNQVLANGDTVIYGVQLNFTTGLIQYTTNLSGSAHWNDSDAHWDKSQFAAGVFHSIEIGYSRDATGVVTYDYITIDGIRQGFGPTASGASNFSLGWQPVGALVANVQFDGDSTTNSTSAYLDEFSITGTQVIPGSGSGQVPFQLTEDMIIGIPIAEQAPLVNQVTTRFDIDENDKFLAEEVTSFGPSTALYNLYGDPHIIESRCLRSAFQGFYIAGLTAFLVFLRYGMKMLMLGQNSTFSAAWTAAVLEPGDQVVVTHSKTPDRTAGVIGMTNRLMEVLDRTYHFKAATVDFRLLDLSSIASFVLTKIAPTGEPIFTAASASDKTTYLFMCDDNDLYSDGTVANLLS